MNVHFFASNMNEDGLFTIFLEGLMQGCEAAVEMIRFLNILLLGL